MLRVTALTTLFPDANRPTFGVFVEGSLLRLAARDDVELTIIAPNGVPPWPLSHHPRFRAAASLPLCETWKGVTVHRPRFALIPLAGWRLNAALVARAAAPLVGTAQVIHADFFHPDGVAAASLGARLRVPVSIKARGSDIHYWGARPPARRAMLDAARRAGGLLAVSAALKADMVSLGMAAGKIAVHYTGVDLDRFAPIDRGAARAALGIAGPLVVSVGALIELKGHDIVIRAVAALPGVALHIVGQGPERERLAALIAALGVGDRVRLTGSMPHDQVARRLAAADVMALASAREGLANAWVEALASGTPVVAPAVGGAPEVIDRPAAGRLAERTPAAFARAIGALLADPPAQADTRAAAMRFGWAAHVDALHAHLVRVAYPHSAASGEPARPSSA